VRRSLLVLVWLAACGAGNLPLVGQRRTCERVVATWKARAVECHKRTDNFDAELAKCDDRAGLVLDDVEVQACVDDVGRLSCPDVAKLPPSCAELFFGGSP